MSGVRSYSFREGDRSEYLAQFLLSGFGLCTAIPRQEDIGFDFSCTLADQESGVLTFGYPYLVSVKSDSDARIVCSPTEVCIKNNDQRHVEWLFRQGLPIFLASVDRDAVSLRMYSLIPLWFIYYEGGPTCGSLTCIPRTDPKQAGDVGRPLKGCVISGWDGKHHFDVDLGHPIAIINLDTLKDKEKIREVKARLRKAIYFAELNLLHSKLGIPHFYWFAKTSPEATDFQPAFYYHPVPPVKEARTNIMKAIAPSLISFALHYKQSGMREHLGAIRTLLSDVPTEQFSEVIQQALPELFNSEGSQVVDPNDLLVISSSSEAQSLQK
jgi:hypothetical protein